MLLHRHEAKYGSSGKSPGERGDMTPTLEPTTQSSGSYWSAREEKYHGTSKSSLGSRQSTKSLSQDDDDENVGSKGRSRSRSQSDWQSEESVSSGRKSASMGRRRRKTENSSCSGSEEYSSVIRERRMSRSSSGGEDVYVASLSRQVGDVGSSLPGRELLREESSENDTYIAAADRRGSISEAAADQREDKCEDIGAVGRSSQDVNAHLPASFAEYESDVKNSGSRVSESGTDCEDENEPTFAESHGNDGRTTLSQSGHAPDTLQQEGEIQLELWQGSSHWNLSVENVVAGNTANPSLEVISVQDPVSDGEVIVSDQVDNKTGNFSVDQEYQVLYDKPDDASEDIVKGAKRPRSPDTDNGSPVSMPSKRFRNESPGSSSDESMKVSANIETTSPRESFAEDETSSSSSNVEQMSTESHTGNSPEHVEPIFQEQLKERRDDLIDEIQLYEDRMKEEMQPAPDAETSDIRGGGSLDVVDVHRDGDKYKETQETTAHSPQTYDGSESSVESKMSPSFQAVSATVATTPEVVVESPPDQDRTDVGAPAFDTSVADESSTPLLTPNDTEVTSSELERMSSIPQTGEISSSSSSHSDVVAMETTAVAEAIEEEECSPGVVSMVAEEEEFTAIEHTEAPTNVETAQSLPPDDQMDETSDLTRQITGSSGITSEGDGSDGDEAQAHVEGLSEQDCDRRHLSGEDALIHASASLPSMHHNSELETVQTIESMSPSSFDVSSPNTLTLEDNPDSLLGNIVADSVESAFVEKHLTVDDIKITSSCSEAEMDEDEGKDLARDDVKMTQSSNETELTTTEEEHVGKELPMDDVKMIESVNETDVTMRGDEHVGKKLPGDDVKMTQSSTEAEPPTTEDEHVGKDLPRDDVKMTQSRNESELPMREDEHVGKDLPGDDVKITQSSTDADLPMAGDVGKELSGDDVKTTQSSKEAEPRTTEDEHVGKDLPRGDVKITQSSTDADLPMTEDEYVGKELSGDDVKMTQSSKEAEPRTTEDEHVGKDLPRGDVKITQSSTDADLPITEDEHVGKDLPRGDVKMTESSTDSELPTTDDEHVGKELSRDDVKMTHDMTETGPPTTEGEHVGKDLPRDDVKLTTGSSNADVPTREGEDMGKDLPKDDVKMTESRHETEPSTTEDELMGKDLPRDDVKMTESRHETEPSTTEDELMGKDLPKDDVKMTESRHETEPSTTEDELMGKDLPRDDVKITQSSTEAASPTTEDEHAGIDFPRDDVKMAESKKETEFPMRDDEHVEIDLPRDDVKMTSTIVEAKTLTTEHEHVGEQLARDDVKITSSSTEEGPLTSEDEHLGDDLPRDDVKITSITEADLPMSEDEHVVIALPGDDVEITSSSTEAELPIQKVENTDNDLPIDYVKMIQSSTDSNLATTDEPVGEELARDDVEITSSGTEAKHPSWKSEQVGEEDDEPRNEGNANIVSNRSKRKSKRVEKPVAKDSVKVSPRNTKATTVEVAKSSPQPKVDESASETCAKGKKGSQNKSESNEKERVPHAEPSTRSVSPRTRAVEVKLATQGLREAGRRKSHRSTAEEHHKVPDTRDHDLRKSTESERPQSVSATMRGRRAGATPPEGSTRESRKSRRAITPPPLRSRRQSGGSVDSGPGTSSSTVRKPTKAVAPPAKGKVDSLHVTRSTRKKSEEASLPIAKRLRR